MDMRAKTGLLLRRAGAVVLALSAGRRSAGTPRRRSRSAPGWRRTRTALELVFDLSGRSRRSAYALAFAGPDRRRYAGGQLPARSVGRRGRASRTTRLVKAFRFGLLAAGQVADGDRPRRPACPPRSNRSRSPRAPRRRGWRSSSNPAKPPPSPPRRRGAPVTAAPIRAARAPCPPVIVLDPGHGGVDGGAHGIGGARRKDAGLRILRASSSGSSRRPGVTRLP